MAGTGPVGVMGGGETCDEDELEDMATDGDEMALRELAWRKAQARDVEGRGGTWRDVGGQPTQRLVQAYTLEKAAEAERDARCLDLAMELKWNSAEHDMGMKILNVLDDLRLWQALAEKREAGWFGEDESEEELEEDGTCGNLEVYKVLRGSSSRLMTLRFRLRGQALGSKGEAPPWHASRFRDALHQAVAPKRGTLWLACRDELWPLRS
eukprot:Skav209431  [mRNA]  locus=scaffold805:119991:125153:- [translate_table: standard]